MTSQASRNDLYSIPTPPPPTPPRPPSLPEAGPSTPTKDRMAAHHPAMREDSPRTSSFFDAPVSPTPTPAPKLSSTPKPAAAFGPSPLSLSRASSLRHRPTPPPPHINFVSTPPSDMDDEALSLLHKSPSLLPNTDGLPEWRPPLPRFTDVSLRFSPTTTYLLGQGRYSEVYLASFKTGSTGSTASKPLNLDRLSVSQPANGEDAAGSSSSSTPSWSLCAAKRMAADRTSQTMGLREAFFLNRLSRPSGADGTLPPEAKGSVYIVKLIAVREDYEHKRSTHSRSSSEAIGGSTLKPRAITRQRSSTFGLPGEDNREMAANPILAQLNGRSSSHGNGHVASISRLLLLLEHAQLGTVDRLLRTSPRLVGRQLWERWARECVEALVWVHSKGVVHADIKPGNLLLTHDLHIRLSDFGSSLLVQSSKPPTDGVGLGTLPFSPPELVNPSLSFSFPIDIFALGATLYQCVTGQEPFRGCRPVEIMHHVKKGDLWVREEHARLSRIGTEPVLGGSPYPSAWRDQTIAPAADGIKRGGSLRIPPSTPQTKVARPKLDRMSSAESLRASNDLAEEKTDSPAGVRLWAKWMKHSEPMSATQRAMTALLSEDEPFIDGTTKMLDPPSRQSSIDASPTSAHSAQESSAYPAEERILAPWPTYEDGAPAMVFLDGEEALSGEMRDALRDMVYPVAEDRPTALELKALWDQLDIGIEDNHRVAK